MPTDTWIPLSEAADILHIRADQLLRLARGDAGPVVRNTDGWLLNRLKIEQIADL